ncbi:MAG: Phospho-N-acetylmuramoyl-pentapeptide-transferase [Parcubacteria group bacterium GW2011_GWB1_45_7]|uniref:Phospho-N-acetylmuramoyl-pentapeptide-transferase n=2 Tax=Candidatus Colwelliibacteriota TaxID=1817904 RepID=A0A1G1ZBL8_9BACT|nr:MAG: Phospho-N-acetylmuramoyl-pentapeptide-transferase [Parcubacteria group bacterium GW2011_GWB1_45_7]OGY58872.1 MAG: phospho-N-acetylmuramoyl-pentapeptide-transferase [Candidatus Colwellbacteria bacterium RIFCSPHIGHO2_02_FULL_45_17]OGY61151.1 MAG: phospho-N-acetylmuramoyl-pentapeptide-transferase [Candidatus Colwellbacteria bacterium RIFCSPLOWO2_02_FULL_45_11]OGY61914.1 MAG: phospho-N-acetylmuramoyl-pentapeptide-transferase [Candidatus Colwellbacteria bacterium RIFCSPLOWO2_12_FULL_46_17]
MMTEAIRVLTVSILSFAVALLLTPAVLAVLKKFDFKKQIRTVESAPIYSKLHKAKEGTPTMGGIIIWGTVLGLAAILFLLDALFDGSFTYLNFVDRAQTFLPIAALLIAAFLGLFDDILGVLRIGPSGGGLTVSKKLILYTVLSVVGAWWFYSPNILDWHVIHVPLLGNFDIGAWYVPIFMFIIVASAFSANETDGLDGLFGGVSLFAFSALAVVAFTLGRYDLATMSGAIVGAILAFLWFNIYPAKFFMGDTGSMALGITLGVMTMLTNTVLLLPFFFIIPIIESLTVIVQAVSKKFRGGKKIFLSTPIHHHFEALGWPESQITMRFWIISVVSTGLGLALFFIDRFF